MEGFVGSRRREGVKYNHFLSETNTVSSPHSAALERKDSKVEQLGWVILQVNRQCREHPSSKVWSLEQPDTAASEISPNTRSEQVFTTHTQARHSTLQFLLWDTNTRERPHSIEKQT